MGATELDQEKSGKRYHIELSGISILLWSTGLFVLLAWIFTLGVLAGKGLLPKGGETLIELKTQIAKIQQMISKNERTELEEIRKLQKDQTFEFFQELSVKKDEAARGATLPTEKPKAQALPTEKASKPPNSTVKYVVQVASLESEAKATQMVKRLTQKGYPAYFYKVFIKGQEYFRIRCGIFKTEAEAVKISKSLAEKEKLTGFVQKIEGN